MPRAAFSSATCCDLTSASVLIGLSPEFSASAIGMDSRASANARIAYCSIVEIYGMEWEDERGKWECEIGMKIKNGMGKMERENESDTLGFQLTPMSEFL